ncbi:MAG: hypothetical protein WC354_07945, partial [Candidatus Omnitrophota bacterium]
FVFGSGTPFCAEDIQDASDKVIVIHWDFHMPSGEFSGVSVRGVLTIGKAGQKQRRYNKGKDDN